MESSTAKSQPPPVLEYDALPEWARRALSDARDPAALAHGRHAVVALPGDRGSRLWPLVVLWPVGIGVLIWAVAALRDDAIVVWRWALGFGLVCAGALVLAHVRHVHTKLRTGMLLAPEGIVVKSGARYRVAPRSAIHEARLEEGRVFLVHGPKRAPWVQFSASPDDPVLMDAMARKHHVYATWLAAGRPPSDAALEAPPTLGALARGVVVQVVVAAAVCGFAWLTLVSPATSDEGRAVRAFIQHIARGEDAQAYALLAQPARERIPQAKLKAELPASFKRASGFTVNSIGGGTARVTCIDGWLRGVEHDNGYAFQLLNTADGVRIGGWYAGSCPD